MSISPAKHHVSFPGKDLQTTHTAISKKERSASFQPQVTNVLPALLLGAASDDVVTWLEFTWIWFLGGWAVVGGCPSQSWIQEFFFPNVWNTPWIVRSKLTSSWQTSTKVDLVILSSNYILKLLLKFCWPKDDLSHAKKVFQTELGWLDDWLWLIWYRDGKNMMMIIWLEHVVS